MGKSRKYYKDSQTAANTSFPYGSGTTAPLPDYSITSELGVTGLNMFGGRVYEEHIKQLRGLLAAKVYGRMAKDDAVIAAGLYTIKTLVRQVPWYVEPAGSKRDDKKKVDFLQYNMDNMSSSWNDVISEILSFIVFGWSLLEIVYKQDKNGKIIWRKLPLRAQESLFQWVFDDEGGLKAFIQNNYFANPRNTEPTITIPIEKCLLFRTEVSKGNPEGRSLLRGCYRAWKYKINIEDIEGIGLERGLAGFPIAFAPPNIMSKNARPDEKALFEELKKVVSNIRVDETTGLVFPAREIGGQKTGYDFTLLAPASKSQFNTNEIINRYKQEIAMTMLFDFLLLGHATAGSYSLSSDKTDLFAMSIKALLDIICDVFNKYAVPRLFALNNFTEGNLPKLRYGDIEKPSLKDIGFFLQSMASGGYLTYDVGLENYLRNMAGIPGINQPGMFLAQGLSLDNRVKNPENAKAQQMSQQLSQTNIGTDRKANQLRKDEDNADTG